MDLDSVFSPDADAPCLIVINELLKQATLLFENQFVNSIIESRWRTLEFRFVPDIVLFLDVLKHAFNTAILRRFDFLPESIRFFF